MRKPRIAAVLAFVLLALTLAPIDAHAASLHFGASSTNVWDYATENWWQDGIPFPQAWYDGSDAIFDGTPCTISVSDTINSVNSLDFRVGGYTLNDGTINMTGSGAITTALGCWATINSELSGSVPLSITSAGTLTLGAANSFTGETRLYSAPGVLRLANAAALQNSTLALAGGNLSFGTLTAATFGGLSGNGMLTLTNEAGQAVALSVGNNNQSTIYNGSLSGKGSLVKVGFGTLTLTNTANFTGDTVLRCGTLNLTTPTALMGSTLDMEGGVFDPGGNSSIQLGGLKGSGNLSFANPVSLYVGGNNKSTRYDGVLSGLVQLYAGNGAGTLTLGGANTFTGNTFLSGYRGECSLRLANPLALQNSTFSLQDGSGSLSFGTLTAATFGGLSGAGTLTLTNESGQPVALSVGNNNQSTTYGGAFAGAGSLVKVGAGTLTLMSYGSFTGSTVLSSGTLLLSNPGALQNSTLDAEGGVLSFGSGILMLGGLKGSGNLSFSGGTTTTLSVNGSISTGATQYNGILSGLVQLSVGGCNQLTLGGANTFTGTTTVLSAPVGTCPLRLGNANALQNSTFTFAQSNGSLSFGTLTAATFGGLTGSGTLTLTNESGQPVALSVGNNNQSTTFSGAFAGAGSLEKVGTGTLTLNSSSNFAGTTVLSSGTLIASSALQNSTLDAEGGVLLPGNSIVMLGGLKGSGNLSFGGSLTLNVGGSVSTGVTQYNGILSGPVQLNVSGPNQVTLGGANTFTGTTTVYPGSPFGTASLRLANSNALQNSTVSLYESGGSLSFGTLTAATFGGLTGYGTLTLANESGQPVALSVGNNNQSTTFSGAFAGPGSLVKVGTGTLTLSSSGGSFFTGTTVLSCGTLAVYDALQNSTLDAEGGVLMPGSSTVMLGGLKGSGNLSFSSNLALYVGGSMTAWATRYDGVLSGQAQLNVGGYGQLTLGGANTFTGDTCVYANSAYTAPLRLANTNALQYSTFSFANGSGSLSFGTLTAATFGGLTGYGTLTLANESGQPVALSVGNNNQSTTYGGTLAGAGSLVKIGCGMLTLSGSMMNYFSGDIVLRSGTLTLNSSGILQSSTLDAEGGVFIPGYSGVALGGLKGSGDLSFGNNLSLNVGGTVTGVATRYDGVLSGPVQLNVIGYSTLTLGGANTFTGTTNVSSAPPGVYPLRLGNSNALQNSTFSFADSSGSLSFGTLTAATFGGLSGPGTLILANESGQPVALSVGNNNQSTTYSGGFMGPGSLVKIGAGTLTLSSNGTIAGTTVLSCGTLALGNLSALRYSTLDAEGGVLGFPSGIATLGGLKGSGNLSFAGSVTLFVNGSISTGATRYDGILSGPVNLSVGGCNQLTLAGANTFTGATHVYPGPIGTYPLRLGNTNALQYSTFSFYQSNGSLSFGTLTAATFGGLTGAGTLTLTNESGQPVALSVGNNNQSTTYSGAFMGSGSLVKIGTGTLALSSSPATTVLSCGGLAVPDYALQMSTLDVEGGGLIPVGNSLSLGGLKGSGNLDFSYLDYNHSTLAMFVGGAVGVAATQYDGVLSGPVQLNVFGWNQLTLGGANTFTGATFVYSSLRLANVNALQNSTLSFYEGGGGTLSFGTLTAATLGGLSGYGVLNLNNEAGQPVALSVGNNNQSTTYSGVLVGDGSLVKVGNGTLTLSHSGGSWTGDTVLRCGTLALANGSALQNSTLDAQGGVLDPVSNSSIALGGLKGNGNLSFTNPVTLWVGGNGWSTEYSGVLSGPAGLNFVGPGVLTLSGANTFTGDTQVGFNPGTLRLANSKALQNSTFSFYSSNGSLSFGPLTAATFGGLSGSGVVTLTNENGQPVNLTVGNNGLPTAFSGTLAGTGTLTKTGSGSLTLATDGFAGGLRVKSGTLIVANSLQSYGSFQITGGTVTGPEGSSATLLSNTAYDVRGGRVELDLASAAVGLNKSGSARAVLTGANSYGGLTTVTGGTLELGSAAQSPVFSLAGADIQLGKIVFDYETLDPIDQILAAIDNGRITDSTAILTGLTLGWIDDGIAKVTVMATYPGDFNLDGLVTQADIEIWAANAGTGNTWAEGDANRDGVVNLVDLAILKSHVGLPALAGSSGSGDYDEPAGDAGSATVPEPGTLALLAVALIGLIACGRRRSQNRS